MFPRRLFAVLLPVLVVLVALVATVGVAAQVGGEHVVMTPAEGSVNTRFVFLGDGFVPGLTVSARFYPPDGIERRMRTEDGAELVWLVQADGTFALDLVPSQRFAGAAPGRWRALFCAYGSPTCQQLDFELTP